MAAYLNIAKHLEIFRCILESVKIKKKDGNKEKQEKKYKKVLGNSLFFCDQA